MTGSKSSRPGADRKRRAPDLPTRDEILAFVAEHPGKVSKREIAKAFGVTGAARVPLKALLKEMQNEGVLRRGRGKRLREPGTLPPVGVVEIIGTDPDGELVAKPVGWREATPPPDIVIAPSGSPEASRGANVKVGDRALVRFTRTEGDDVYEFEARVIRRLGAEAETLLGVFRATPGGGGRLEPVDRRNRREYDVAKGDEGDARSGHLVRAETLGRTRYGLRKARVLECLGKITDERSISLIAIHEFGIPTSFPERVLDEAGGLEPPELGRRTDLRDLPLVTIDPEDARDHDDAVWAGPDEDPANQGGFVVVVAIADVAAFVAPASALDEEARKRGNSAYFPDRVVPMLPERISNDLCSLREAEDRPSLTVRMTFDADGKKKRHRFERAVIRSAAKLTYRQAQSAIEGRTDEATGPLLNTVLKPLFKAYHALASARDLRQPLDLDLPELKIRVDKEGRVEDIHEVERLDAHRLIEEFMIQANVCAAETLEQRRSPLIYRVHDAPSAEKLKALGEFLATLDIPFAKGQRARPEHFNRILGAVRDTEHQQVVSEIVLRSQSQAVYSPENLGHFGLNLRHYAHFTSPIRRYADLIVHRALIKALGLGDDGLTADEIEELDATADHISVCERRAMAAERASKDRYLAAYLESRIGGSFEGRIAGVTRFGLFVRLSETGADGIVPMATLGQEYFQHDERRHSLIGEETGATYRLGDPVTVRLEEATPISGGLRFELLDGGSQGPARGRNRATGKKAGGHRRRKKR